MGGEGGWLARALEDLVGCVQQVAFTALALGFGRGLFALGILLCFLL